MNAADSTSYILLATATAAALLHTLIPDHWLPYALVGDCDDAAGRAVRLGGIVIAPPIDLEQVGRFAVLQDPGGAHIAVIRLDARE